MRDAHRVPLVLIQGETGTGKGVLARALHTASSRSAKPFVALNCAAIPDTLAESELFGFEAGAHSEARRAKPGLFQAAAGGTIFLDEVGLLSAAVQAKLLKVIDDRRVRRIGSTHDEPVDVWIISATNSDLEADVRDQKFRPDLYQRLAVVRLALPPLRERGADITQLAEEFVARTCADYGLPRKQLAPDAQTRLTRYPWPGNVRELANVVERAVLLADSEILAAEHLELDPTRVLETPAPAPPGPATIRDRHLAALEETGWNISRAASQLGISRKTLRARIERLGLRSHRQGGASPAAPALDGGLRRGQDRSSPGGREPVEIEGRDEATAASTVQGEGPPETTLAPRADRPSLGALDTGASLAGPLPEPPMPARLLRWQRRRVSLLRVNLILPADSDPLSSGQAALDEVLEKAQVFGGRLEGLSTSWATISFGATELEDSSNRAAHAALAIQRAAARGAGPDRRRRPPVIATLETGHLLVARDGRAAEVDRDGLHALDRQLIELVSRCEAGWIGVGPHIGPFLERRFQLERIEDRDSLAAPAYRLVGPKSPGQSEVSAPLPFVGREAELALLKNRLEPVAHGHGQILAVVGESGIGKSRLLSEFCRTLDSSDFRVLHAQALLPTGPSLLPAIDLVRRHLEIEDRDGEAEVRAKVERAIPLGGRVETRSAAAVSELLGIPASDPAWAALAPTERREQTLQALRELLLAASQRGPLVVVFEDLHWVDSETQALIDKLVETVPASRILLVIAYRPEYRHQWESRMHYSELWLEPLTRKDAARLLDNLMGDDQTVTAIKVRLIDWTEGNPFFLEEAVRYLATAGALVGEQGGYRLVVRPDAVLQIPPTVEDVLAERIDRLSPDLSAILECAAVVGREAPLSVLSAVLDRPEERLYAGLKTLHEAGLLHETGAPVPVYRFKHQLTHEVTYGRLPHERRRALHAAVFRHLEAANPAPSGEALDHLAFHAFHGESWESAAAYCRRAGERANRRSSSLEAAEYFRQARSCLEHLPETEERRAQAVDILFGLRRALWPQGRLDEMGAVLREAEGLATRFGDLRRQGMVAAYLADYLWATGDNAAAAEAGTRALSIAERVGDDILVRQARFDLGLARAALGQYREAAAIVEPAVLPMKDGPHDHQWRVIVLAKGYLARYLAELGDFARGISLAQSGLAAAESAGDSFALLGSLLGLGTLHLRRADFPSAIAVLSRGLELARARGHVNWVPSLSSSLGLAYALSGQVTDGLDLLAQALAAAENSGIRASQPLWMAYAAEGHIAAGRAGSARGLAERALEIARARGESGHEAWALRALANALAQVGTEELDHAIERIQQATERAGVLGMQPLVARCQSDLSRLLDRRGRRADAVAARETASRLWIALGMAGVLAR